MLILLQNNFLYLNLNIKIDFKKKVSIIYVMPILFVHSKTISQFYGQPTGNQVIQIGVASKSLGYNIKYLKGFLVIIVPIGFKLPTKKNIINAFPLII